jgi:FtsH-binding integral membrane protein
VSTVSDVASLATSVGPTLSGVAAVLGVIYVRSPKRAKNPSSASPPAGRWNISSLPAQSATLALLLAGLEGLLAALLIVVVGTTTIGLDQPAVRVFEWSVLATFVAAITLACLSLPAAIANRQEQQAVRMILRSVSSLTLAICALLASLIVGSA